MFLFSGDFWLRLHHEDAALPPDLISQLQNAVMLGNADTGVQPNLIEELLLPHSWYWIIKMSLIKISSIKMYPQSHYFKSLFIYKTKITIKKNRVKVAYHTAATPSCVAMETQGGCGQWTTELSGSALMFPKSRVESVSSSISPITALKTNHLMNQSTKMSF